MDPKERILIEVQQALLSPGRCAITHSEQGPFLDTTNSFLGGTRVYVSREGAAEVAKWIGWVSPESVDSLNARIAKLQVENAELKDLAAEAESFRLDVEHTLNEFGKKVVGKPGPKPSKDDLAVKRVERARKAS